MKKLLWLVILMGMAVVLVFGACTQPAPTPAPTPAPAPAPQLPNDVVIASLPGSTMALSQGLSSLITKEMGISAVPVQGLNVQNATMLISGEANIASLAVDMAQKAVKGTSSFADKGPQPVRMLFASNYSPIHLAAWRGSGISTFADIRGKRLVIDLKPTPFVAEVGDALLKFHGMTRDGITPISVGSHLDTMNALRDRTADMGIQPGSHEGSSYWMELTNAADIDFISMTEDEINYLLKTLNYLVPDSVPANVYRLQDKEIQTVGFYVGWAVNRDASDDFVYRLMKILLDDVGPDTPGRFKEFSPVAGGFTLKEALAPVGVAPLHAAAVKYYQDRGIWTPELEQAQQKILAEIGESK
ncbi:MAG: TAXI family TRAP transporter solute-binding subunit [Chloroflexota bacterium]